MPNKIVSKSQQRFLFATNPTLARELAGGQSFHDLPERKGKKPHNNKKKPHRTKHASPLDPAVDADALVEKLALGALGSAPQLGSGLGLVRPTLKPQGMTLSAINANRPTLSLKPKAPALSPTPAQAPAPNAGTGQLGEQTAQAVVQTARNQAPNPAQVGTPPAPSVPKLGSHGLARRDVVAALIGGPDYSPTPCTGECDAVKEAGAYPGLW